MHDYSFYYGSAIFRLLESYNTVKIKIIESNIFEINSNFLLFFKHSTKRLPPWTFTFQPNHIHSILELKEKSLNLYIVFICYKNGICCLSFNELRKIILIGKNESTKWVRVSRSLREKYTVTGSNGKLKYKIGNSDFPNKCFIGEK